MANKIFKMQVFFSLNGRSNRDVWSNTVHVSCNLDIKTVEFKDLMTEVANRYKPYITTDVHVLRVKANQIGANLLNAPDTTPRTVHLNSTGARTPELNNVQTKTAPIEMAFEVFVNPVLGRPGILYLRGALGENELTTSGNGEYELVDGAGPEGGTFHFGAGLPSFNAPLPSEAKYVIPDKVDTLFENLVQRGRDVAGFTAGGVVVLKRNRKRMTAEQMAVLAAQREINRVAARVSRMIRNNSNWATVAATVAAIAALIALPEALVAALPAGAAASIEIPAVWGTAATTAQTVAWWAKYGTKLL